MSTSLRSHRRSVGRGVLGLAASLAVIATFLVPLAINPTPALADTSAQIGTGVECANDNWQAETTADNAGHVYVFYTNYCSNHDFLWYQVSNDGGQTFGPAQTLCSALGAACTLPQANTQTIGGTGYKTEDDPGVFVDTSVSPPKLYVVWDATPSFSSFSPDVVLGAVSSDFGSTFTMLNGAANIGGVNCGGGGNAPDCGFPQVTAKGSNVTVSSGSYATGGAKHNQLKIVNYSANGGTSFASAATSGATATNGNWYYALRSVLDSSGNTWTLWFNYDGTAGTGTFIHYELSKTTSGSSTTTWVTSFYTAPDGPTYPGQAMASGGGYPAGWWGGTADLAIDGTNHLYVVFQDGRGHTTDGNPSILKAGTCALASGTCTALGAVAGTWTAQSSTVRVDDKDATGCGGTEGAATAKCSLSFPRLTSTSGGTLSLSWVDDRNATVAGCSPNPRFSHTCGLNMWVRTSTTGISGFTTPSVLLSDHSAFSPVWDSDNAGFKFFYGGSDGITANPACTNQPFAAWTESVDYNGGSTNGGRVLVKNTQSGPASPASLTAIPSGTTINLSWPASAGGGVTGYKVYRGSGSNGDNLALLTTLGNVTSYANTGLTTGQTFTYAVSAITASSEGCQSVRASATAGATVRTLNLATSPGAVGCSNIATTPAPTSGNGTCTRTYADGAVVTVTATTPVAIDASSRYRFNAWSGDATGSGSPTVTMSADRNVTANYVKQWAVTIQATGLTCDAPIAFYCDTGNTTVATVQGSPYLGGDLAYAGSGFPTKAYIDNGGTLTYSYASTVAVPGSTDIPQTLPADANKQYRLDALSGPATGSTVSSAVTINGTYVTQRKVTFSQSGIGGDSTGTVVQVNGTGTTPANASLGAGSLGAAAFYDDGSSWAYQSPVASSTTGKRYTVGATSGTLSAADEGTTKSGSYTTQWLLTLATGPGGIGTGHITPNPTSATGYYNTGTSVSLTADTAVTSGGSPYTFQNWTGDVATPPNNTNPISVTMNQARNVTANYSLDSFGLSVSKSGNGSGTVTSSPAGITCGATCSNTFPYGTSVTLTATPTTGSTFTGWSGGGCSGTGTCVVSVTAATSVTAQFTLQTFSVNVSKSGNGSGSVSSSPAGITCGATCSNAFDYGTSVTLTATPATGSTFTGWSGGGCSGTGTCVLSVTAATSVTAQFTLQTKTLDVTTNGNGSGSVGSSPAGITCGATCSAGFDYGTVVTLTATPAASSDFTGWSGSGCSGTSTCIVTMDAARSVTATFTLKMENLSVSKTGTGTGSVSSSPVGITCGATCSAGFNYGTVVTLTATPAASSDFTGWSGEGCSGTSTCLVTVDQARSVTATFALKTETLNVSNAGTGSGSVGSSPGGISCGATCSAGFSYGTVVTLTGTPATSSTFTGWSGEGCSGTGTCLVTLDQARSVTATFTLKTPTLTLSKNGNGSGSVGSSPAGIACGATCSHDFNYGTVVTLTATPAVSSDFTGWSGEGCSGAGTCIVTLDQARSVTATFTLKTENLTVSKNGTGSGTVTSAPATIDCGVTCSAGFDYGTVVTLTATPTTGSNFTGWSGEGCSGAGTCIVTLDQARSVTATFTLQTRTLDVNKGGLGSGSVSSSPAGINCGATCSHAFDYGTVVTLTATPSFGSVFTGWAGSGCSGTGDCVVTMDAAHSVTANFSDQPQQTLDVAKNGTGTGSVTSTPAGIDCGPTCSITFDFNTDVTLTATPDANSTFAGWSGAGCSGTGGCVVTMNAARSVTATFTLKPPKTLDVAENGTGSGSVGSTPAGITCGATCTHDFAFGTVVTLTATPDASADFTGWSGAGCTGTGDCIVTMDAVHSVTATFTLKTETLNVTKDGTGSGSVSSNPAGITCGGVCSHGFDFGTSVTLSANPSASSDFAGWSGEGCTGTGDCVVALDQARSVTATFALKSETLNVSKNGTGSGSVSSSPAGIACGATCATGFDYGTVVTLTAAAGTGSDFTAWSGEGCVGTGDCQVTLNQARSVTATFTLETPALDVTKNGTGTGSISSTPAGIDCGATCSSSFDYGTTVTLTADPATGSNFTGWTGEGCTGTGDCVVTLDQARSVAATFTLASRTLDVSANGTGSGSVSSSPAGIDCGATCSSGFDYGTVVTLTATADLGSDFTGWSGAGCSGTGDCVVTMDAARSVTAAFGAKPDKTLDVSADGTGSGSATSTPAGIDCGATCTNDFAFGTVVTLTATPDPSSDFAGWSGAGCSGTGDCVVTMDAARSVTATFTLKTETLDVIASGSGTGSITSSPAGIDCGATCSVGFDYGTVVGLTATPVAGSTFIGWTGDCTGLGPCNVTLDQARSVTATFTATAHQPDGRIGTSSKVAKMVGDNVYNTTGKTQSKSGKAKHNKTKTFYVSVQNDGSAPDTIALKGSKSAKGFTVKYYAGKKDVTKQVVRGTYQLQNLAAGGTAKSIKVVVKVKSTAKIGAVQKLTITASSGVSASDVVKAKVKAVR